MAETYDTAIVALVDAVDENWGADAVRRNLILRDAVGRLTFVVLDERRSGAEREALSSTINTRLQGYADRSGISAATPEELFDDQLRVAKVGSLIPVNGARFKGNVRVVDRRVVGADWLHTPGEAVPLIPRLFFVSLKGGVGRSTALCVLAAHLASSGRRVLAVDLDLEAPGLGSMLLTTETMPKYGVLDFLVENNIGPLDEVFTADMMAPSPFGAGRGVLTVVPALGQISLANPENILGKIARAYILSDASPESAGFSQKVEKLLDSLTSSRDHDVILVDARAGLHESTAAAVVALRGETLLFGADQPQTFLGYSALLAQLAITLGPSWTERIHLVEARVGADGPSDDFLASMAAIMPNVGMLPPAGGIALEQLRETFDVEWDVEALSNDSADNPALDRDFGHTFIYESDVFKNFDPLKTPDRLERGMYSAVFGGFLNYCDEVLVFAEAEAAGGA